MFKFKETAFLLLLVPCSTAFLAVQGTLKRHSYLLSTVSTEGNERTTTSAIPSSTYSWQDDVEKLLDPTTPPSQRQQLVSRLMQQNSSIRQSAEQALRQGSIDPLLTPTGRRMQDGTRTVARQVVRDILPSLFSLSPPKLEDVFNTNQRIMQSFSSQVQNGFETIASDLSDPATRIPARIRQQTTAVASTVLSGTPADLQEPVYNVVARRNYGTADEYEIREYSEYEVASTTIDDSVAVAYQRLATYIAGANAEHRVLSGMPVSMRTGNELRFYVRSKLPLPLTEDTGKHRLVDNAHKIRIETIPAATLAVRKFTGFCTEGEIQIQKELLLKTLNSDQAVELDVPHGRAVGHLVFEYNPPVAVPIVRRNEIAVQVFNAGS